ncbi:hypothetical protein [Acinetobacter calcoaceticus]|uniref:hypothetical protein n=1 Tax=Acinetobacter calcoaceticus TaxID=471 RepID=UPI003AF7BF07
MNNFEAWVGKKEIYHDICNDKPITMMQAVLNQYGQPITEVPYLFHWLYFLPIFNQSELAEDGHAKKGVFYLQFLFQNACGLVVAYNF